MAAEKTNILLVDDEPKNLVALESLLESPDRELIRAGSGFDALRRLLEDDFALIILDVQMPGMDGFETAEFIRERERSRDTPIIFLTAAARGEFPMVRGYALGAVDYIIKPVDPDILRFKVGVFVELYRKTREVKRQSEEIAQSRAFLDSVLEGVTEHAIAALDLEGRVQVWNEGARRIYGYTPEAMLGRSARILDGERPGSNPLPALLERVNTEGRVEADCEHVQASGRRFAVHVTISRRTDDNGAPAGYVFVAKDLTTIRQAAEARVQLLGERAARAEAEAAQERLQQMINVLPEAVVVTDPRGRLVMSNAAARAMVGDIALGTDVVHNAAIRNNAGQEVWMARPDGLAAEPERLPLARSLESGETIQGEQYLVRTAAGTDIPVLVNAAPVSVGDEVVWGVMVFQDITAIKDLDEQKDEFLAAVSHDLRNPLTIIAGNAQLLERRSSRLDSPEAAFFTDLLRSINRTTRRATSMVNELLDLTRVQMRRPLQLERREVDLARLAEEATNELARTAERHEIRFSSNGSQPAGEWDRDRLYRVLSNLIENAVKFSPDGGPVEVEVTGAADGQGQWGVLSVRDRGVGIPPEDLPHIFERFYRGANVSGRISGSGIGLTVAKQVVEAHGGCITVECPPEGGTRVSIKLPATSGVAEAVQRGGAHG